MYFKGKVQCSIIHFATGMDMDLYEWKFEGPGSRARETARTKEVSPCSEYTRYTVEGILKDPWSDLSARFDVETLGILFANSSFHDPRWSDRLGYGMAVIGEDTRVHLHQNGKYIIRRALDREHAEISYKLITGLLRPVLFDDPSGKPMWYLLREITSDPKGSSERLDKLVRWPYDDDLHLSAMDEVKEGIRHIHEMLLMGMQDMFKEGPFIGNSADIEELTGRIKGEMTNAHGRSAELPYGNLGRTSALIWAHKAVEEAKVMERASSDNDPRRERAIRRIAFLLHPVV
jgi:hypothetical protein